MTSAMGRKKGGEKEWLRGKKGEMDYVSEGKKGSFANPRSELFL